MAKSPYRDIPPPGTTIDTLRAAVEALKENLEILQGQRGVRGRSSQIFYVDPKNATEIPEGVNDGDIWVQSPRTMGGGWTISVWKDGKWS